jgi:hypothetical protein
MTVRACTFAACCRQKRSFDMTDLHDAWLAKHRARWLRPNARLYMRADAQRFLRPDAQRFLRHDWQRYVQPGFDPLFVHAVLEGKANFNPAQRRVPAGPPDGGQWTREGGESGNGTADGAAGTDQEGPGGRAPLRIVIYPRDSLQDSGPTWEGPTFDFSTRDLVPFDFSIFEPPPEIPERRPPSTRVRNRVVKKVAGWAARAVLRAPLGPVGVVITIAEVAMWLHESYPYIQAYLDPPKSLDELQRAAAVRKKGYDVHHIVEQAAGDKLGFSRAMIDGPDNRVRIPTLKHWQLTGWYMTPNKVFGGQTPRAYLVGKSWEEHVRVGKLALIKVGVLRP